MSIAPFLLVLLIVFYMAFPGFAMLGTAAVVGFIAWLFVQGYAARIARRADLSQTQSSAINLSLPVSIVVGVAGFWFATIDSFESLISMPMIVFYLGLAWSVGTIAGILDRLAPKVTEDEGFEYPFFLQNFKKGGSNGE